LSGASLSRVSYVSNPELAFRIKRLSGFPMIMAARMITRASAALRSPAGDLVLLADSSLVLEPNFYLADIDRLFARDFIQVRWELF
jgi:hypothetical protein